MNTSSGRGSFTGDMLRAVSPWEPGQSVNFDPGEVVSKSYSIKVGARGKRFWIPASTAAVITACDGTQHEEKAGEAFLYGPLQGVYYECRFVDLNIQKVDNLHVSAKSKDGWQVGMVLSVTWRVSQPQKVVLLAGAGRTVLSAIQAAADNLIRYYNHDYLAQVTGSTLDMIDSRQIAGELWRDVQARLQRYGIEVQDVAVLERLPDTSRETEIKHAYVERTQMELEKWLIEQRAAVKRSSLEQERHLLAMESDLVLGKATMERKAAEELDKVRVAKAKNTNEEAQILFQSEAWKAEIKRLMQLPEFEHIENLAQIEANGQLLSGFLQAFAVNQSTGLGHHIDPSVMGMMLKTMGEIAHPPKAERLPAPNGAQPPVQKLPAMQRLAEALYSLEGQQDIYCDAVITRPDGTAEARIVVRKLVFTLVVSDDFPQAAPCELLVQFDGNEPVSLVSELEWKPGMQLLQYLKAAYMLMKFKGKALYTRNSNHHTLPPEKAISK